jgi:Holliday junction DNA helicase RuvB
MRPQNFSQFIGQSAIKNLVALEIKDKNMPRHILLYGMPGLGKTTLARVIANEAGLKFHYWQASKSLTQKKMAAELYALDHTGYTKDGQAGASSPRHLVFIDEVHKLVDFETLYPVLEDRIINPDPFGGISWIPFTTFVVATTNPNALPKPFKDRFALKLRLNPYTQNELAALIKWHFGSVTTSDAEQIAKRSRGTARIAVNYAESVLRLGLSYFDAVEIDANGLSPLDRAVVNVLRRAGRPLSLRSLASLVREDPKVIETEVEPFLLEQGLMEVTAQGRVATGIVNEGSRNLPLSYTK